MAAIVDSIHQITPGLSLTKVPPPPNRSEEIQKIFTSFQKIAQAAKQPKRENLTPIENPNWIEKLEPEIQNKRIFIKVEDFQIDGESPRLVVNSKNELSIEWGFDGFRLTLEGRSYWIYNLKEKKQILALTESLRHLLNGNEYEIESNSWKDLLEIWDTNWKERRDNGQVYREQVYPFLRSYVKHLLDSGKKNILEICGGDGELAEKILEENEGNISTYHLLDTSEESCKKANHRLSGNGKVHVHQQSITEDYTNLVQPGSVDLIIGSGALTQGVLRDNHTAKKALSEICRVLKRGGVLLLSGKTLQWLNAEDMKTAGFSVKNMTIPSTARQCYVAIYEPNK